METLTMNASPESGVFDKKGCKMSLWVSYQHTWIDTKGNARNNQTYYLKFKGEEKYEGISTELPRAFELIENIYKEGRKFKTLALYLNWNAGNTHPDKTIINPLVFKIVNKNGNLEFTLAPLSGDDSGNAAKYIKEQFERINEIHHSV